MKTVITVEKANCITYHLVNGCAEVTGVSTDELISTQLFDNLVDAMKSLPANIEINLHREVALELGIMVVDDKPLAPFTWTGHSLSFTIEVAVC